MKWMYALGNPAYQMENKENNRQSPIYNCFMDEAYKIANCVEMITPARFLFNAGQTPKSWNEKMLNDPHLKVVHYEPDASKVFPSTEIKGGVAITLRNANKNFGSIGIFTSFPKLNDILIKVRSDGGLFMDSIISARGNYRLTAEFFDDFPYAQSRLGKGTGNMIASNFFEKIPEVSESEKEDDDAYTFLCRLNNKREFRSINRKYVQDNPFLHSYNVACPKSNGNGVFGEVLTSVEILSLETGATDTFISIGTFETKDEALSLQKYIKCKFFRALLGVKKVTQDNPKSVWDTIPLQDFTSNSDIDWSKSVKEIDEQLYRKYNLDESEIEFIETHVKEMI